MNAPQKFYTTGDMYPPHQVSGQISRPPDNSLVAIEQVPTAESVLHQLADLAEQYGHVVRQIRYQAGTHIISLERARLSPAETLGCDIIIRVAHTPAQLVMKLARRPSADEHRWLEMAGHKAVLRVQECTRERLPQTQHQTAGNTGDQNHQSDDQNELIGTSAPMLALARDIQQAAPFNSTVLISGESGTGKELVARAVHRTSPRAKGPFVIVNCNALTETILESQMFGHVKGAFTGAHADVLGLVRAAASGTLFLDEIGDMPLPVQGKLLRVLQEHAVTPVGSSKEIKVGVRFMAATNKDLAREVREGRFRHDLYQRLLVIEIVTPPLREHLSDVPTLVQHFLSKLTSEMNLSPPVAITSAVINAFGNYHWPGNVRELEHVMTRLLVRCSADAVITGEAALAELNKSRSAITPRQRHAHVCLPTEMCAWNYAEETLNQYTMRVRAAALESLERQLGDVARAAQCLGRSTKAFYQLRRRAHESAHPGRRVRDGNINSNNPMSTRGEPES